MIGYSAYLNGFAVEGAQGRSQIRVHLGPELLVLQKRDTVFGRENEMNK